MAALPVLKDSGLSAFVDDLYVNHKMDLRHELALYKTLGKQAIPVVFNEIYARMLFFLIHLEGEIIDHNGLKGIDWSHVIPFRNRTNTSSNMNMERSMKKNIMIVSEPIKPTELLAPELERELSPYICTSNHVNNIAFELEEALRNATNGTYYDDGDYYCGETIGGLQEGYGVYKSHQGWLYAGNFNSGTFDGFGLIRFAEGGYYKGYWKDGERTGRGEEITDNGDRYIGFFVCGLLEGQGILIHHNGPMFDGYFIHGSLNGYGHAKFSNGEYMGNFLNGTMHGDGTYSFNNGDRYSGHFENGKIHGYGEYRWANGKTQREYWN